MLQMLEADRILLLPVFYATISLDVPDPITNFHRIALAIAGISHIPEIHPDVREALWPRVWAVIQLFQHRWTQNPGLFSDSDIGPINFFCIVEKFLYENGEGPLNSAEGLWTLVGHAWRQIMERADLFGDSAFRKLCRFLCRARITRENARELIVGAGGPSDLALVIVQHIKVGQIALHAHEDAIYLAAAIRFILKPEDDSFRSSLLQCDIVSVLTDPVHTIGSSVGELKSLSHPSLLNHGLCALMDMVIGSTRSPPIRSTYYWPLKFIKAGLLETLMEISCHFSDSQVVLPVETFLTQILPATLVDCTVVTRVFRTHAPLAQALHSTRIHGSFLHQPWEIFLKLVIQRAGVLSKYENAISMRACDNGCVSTLIFMTVRY